MLRRGLFLPIFGELASPTVLAALASEAEAAGWDGVFVWDHIDYRRPVTDVTDPWIALAAIALATDRVTIGPMVTPLARRRPQVVARQIAAVDSLASGRFVFGAGLGMDTSGGEFSRFGEPADDRLRAEMLDEALPLLRALLDGGRVDHQGDYYTALDAQFLPAPTTRVPFWIAARWPNRRPVVRATRFDGLFVIDVDDPSVLTDVLEFVTAARGSLDSFDVIVRTRDNSSSAKWEAAGATWWLADFDPFSCDAAAVRKTIATP
jgi:alkanesulfonate monooxygenase SsuD/methylene tetrahydromethanopterin reductase-like flavin-dependent oxidoreductase (luciferase family)